MFWNAVWLLLSVRLRLLTRTFARSSATLAGVILFTLVFGPAALAAGSACEHKLLTLTRPAQGEFLGAVLLATISVWLLSLLAGGVVSAASRLTPAVVRSYPVPPRAFVTAAALGSLADLPTLLALPLFFAIVHALTRNGTAPLALTAPFFLLALTVTSLEQVIRVLGLRSRTLALGVGALLVASWSTKEALLAIPHHETLRTTFFLLVLVAQLFVLLFLADRALLTAKAPRSRISKRAKNRPALTPELTSPLLSRLAVAAAVEWRTLLRNLPAHLPLRVPGQLLLGIFYGWIAPNLGGDALLNARDLCGMGGVIYLFVWQLQLLTNRFGSEAGTCALLLGFPVARYELLLVRNATLVCFLALVNGLALTLLCLWNHAPQFLAPGLVTILAVLVLATALGNIVSLVYPYPIARRTEGYFVEPDRGLVFVYVVLVGGIGCAVAFLSPIVLFFLCATLYSASLVLGDWLLRRNERALIARLDGE